jgi:hypothetical protein
LAVPAPLTAWRYVTRGIVRRPLRSTLASAGVAVAVAFFIVFASMSAGLHRHVEDELARPRPTHVSLEHQSPTPYSTSELALLGAVVGSYMEGTGAGAEGQGWAVDPVAELVLSVPRDGPRAVLWGIVPRPANATTASPPGLPADAPLSEGRLLVAADEGADGLVCVLGAFARDRLFPSAAVNGTVSLGPDASADPWRLPSAEDYPLDADGSWAAEVRGPLDATVVGVLAPSLGGGLDDGVFVPVLALLRAIGQMDGGVYYFPRIVVTVADGTRMDVGALEDELVRAVPLTIARDDGWDRASFERTYGQTQRALDSWLWAVTSVMALMLVAGVSDTMLVTVAERRAELATLRATGAKRRQLSRLVLCEVALLGAIGLVAGLCAGAGATWALGALAGGKLLAPPRLAWWVVAAAALVAMGAVTVAGYYPARRAALERPTEALRYE